MKDHWLGTYGIPFLTIIISKLHWLVGCLYDEETHQKKAKILVEQATRVLKEAQEELEKAR